MSPAPRRPRALNQLLLARFREFIREPEAVFWTFVFPILMATGLGIAFRSRPAEVTRIAVVSTAPGAEAVRRSLAAQPAFLVECMEAPAADEALRIGRVALVVSPQEGQGAVYRYDQDRPEARTARLLVDQHLQRAAGRQDALSTQDVLVSEPGSRYIDFVVPGLIAMNLMSSGIWGLGFGIVDARRKKLLKRLVATPMSRADFLLSFLLMRLAMMVLEVGVLVAFATLAFGVPLRGPVTVFVGINVLATLMFGALGLLVASRVQTVEGASGLMNFVMLPMWVASGIFFASSNFPDSVQPLIRALPLTAAVDALRSTMLQGTSWGDLLPQLGVMIVWLLLCFGLALKLFRWR